jgi:hypothetical protein
MSASDTTTTGGFETITAAALEAWIANWLVRTPTFLPRKSSAIWSFSTTASIRFMRSISPATSKSCSAGRSRPRWHGSFPPSPDWPRTSPPAAAEPRKIWTRAEGDDVDGAQRIPGPLSDGLR